MDGRTALRESSARRVDSYLAARGLPDRVVELPVSTRTAAEAAAAVGSAVRQIVKSLVFRAGAGGPPVLFLVAGDNRVDERRAAGWVGAPLVRADPEFVREISGYAIGGVPPAGHARPIPAFVDYDLLTEHEIWAAAGHPHAVFRLTPLELLRLTHARPVELADTSGAVASGASWVTFDCFGTLVDWRAGLAGAARRCGWAASRTDAAEFVRSYLAEEPNIESPAYRPYRDVLSAVARRVLERRARAPRDAELTEFAASVPDWPAFPDAPPLLRALRAEGRRVAILSNIDRDLLAAVVDRAGFEVDLTVTAEEVRSYKPAPAHWVRFLRASGAAAARTLHVSASYDYDLETAELLGFATAYVARYGPLDGGRRVGRSVPDLADVRRLTEG